MAGLDPAIQWRAQCRMAVVYLYLATQETLVHLTKQMEFERVPIAGDWLRFEAGGLFPHQVTEITFNPDGGAEVVLGIRKDQDGRWMLFESNANLDADVAELISAGWRVGGRTINKLYRNR